MGIQKWAMGAISALALASASHAAGFINGGFEDGTANGWTEGGATRNADLSDLVPSNYLNGAAGRSSVVTAGTVDPVVGAALGTTVYSGNSSYRVEDTTDGGYLSVISQTVNGYTDANIFFAWKAVLESNHSAEQAAGMKIELVDLTANQTVISRIYSAETSGGVGQGSPFSLLNGYYYTPDWQIEQLTIDATRLGHDFRLTVLATDCDPTAHLGYVYLDGFGAVTPPPTDVPEPASALLAGTALLALYGARRRKQG